MSKKFAYLVLVIVVIISALATTQLSKIRFYNDFDMFFPEDDPDLIYYQELVERYGTDNDYLYLSIPDDSIFSATFLKKLDELTNELEKWEEIEAVYSLTNHTRFRINALGAYKIPSVNLRNPNKQRILENTDLRERFIANDLSAQVAIIRHIGFEDKTSADQFLEKLNIQLGSQFEDVIVGGKIEAQYRFMEKLEMEQSKLLVLSMSLVSLALLLIFRTFRGLVIPLLILGVTTLWSISLFTFLGKEMDVMMVMVPPILLVVAMSDVIHFCSKFNELKTDGINTYQAVRTSFRSIGKATLLTSVSTAVGFASLATSPIRPIQDFGIYTAIGIMVAFIVAFSILPAILTLSDKPLTKSARNEQIWTTLTTNLFEYVFKNRKRVLLGFALVALIITSGSLLLRQNTFTIIGLKKSDPLMAKIKYFDTQFNGVKTFQMTLDIANNDLFAASTLRSIKDISNYLENEYEVGQIQSPLRVILSLQEGISARSDLDALLADGKQLGRIKRIYNSRAFSEFRNTLQTNSGNQILIIGTQKDFGSYVSNRKRKEFEQFLATKELPGIANYRLTGTSFLIDKTDTYVAESLLKSLGLGLLLVSIILGSLFRKVKYVLISLVPNIVPLAMLAGLMGFFQVDLNISTTLIFSVAFGIAVDDSIHFLSRFQQELKLQDTKLEAVRRTFISTGKSIVLTTIVLSSGFALLATSGFSAAFFTGTFVGAVLIIALVADLTILPILLIGRKAIARQD